MTQPVHYTPIRKTDVDLGKPLPYSIYDGDRNLLLKRGFVVETMAQLERLAENGLYRDSWKMESVVGTRKGSLEGDGKKDRGEQQPRERNVALDEIKFGIGDALQVQMQIDQSESRHYVKLIGYLKGKSVLVTVPEIDGNLCLVREGQAFVVRFFAGKDAYAFTSSVIRTTNIPFPHLHLSYPSQVKGLIIRASDRVAARLICSVSMQGGTSAASTAGAITNLSVGGALLLTKAPLGVKGDLVSIKFRLQILEAESYVTIDATIRSVTKGEAGAPVGEYQHGVQFANLSNEDAIALTAFVYQKLAANSTN